MPSVLGPVRSVLAWGGVILAAVVAAWVATVWIRQALRCGPPPAWSLEALEEMRRLGQITEEEFRLLRASATGLLQGRAENDELSLRKSPSDDDGPHRGGRKEPE